MGQERRYDEASIEGVLDGRYRLRREIARGGHGAVLEAEHQVTHARVAIKTLLRPALDLPAARERLIREACVLAALRHPNVIAVHDAGTCPLYGPYVVLELVEGRPLDGILLTRQKLPVGQTVALVVQLCDALSDVHYHGVVHRDVKPSNVLIARAPNHDHLELIDFGIAKVQAVPDDESDKLTKMGELLGTVDYMAPEQLMGSSPVDARSDVYSVGVCIYECLTGEVPYSGSPTAVMANMLAGTRPTAIRSKRNDVPPALEAAIRKACEIDPGKRFASAAELSRSCAAAFGSVVPALDLLEGRAAGVATAAGASRAPNASAEGAIARRQYTRAPYVTPVRMLMAHGATDGRTEDLSEGGVLMVTEGVCADGERVRLRLPLPVSGRVVELHALAKWTKTRRNQRAIGAEFIDLPDDIRSEIRAYMALMTGATPTSPRVGS